MLMNPMAAVARSPEPPDPVQARVPCPFCGGPLHPVAGRCKHCKQDVGTHRSRAAGVIGLPGGPGASGAGGKLSAGSLPQLGDRAAGVSLGAAHAAEPARALRASWLRNWPLLVILLAVVGMIVALVLLILPQRHSTIRRNNGLSNDRMETESLPGSGNKAGGKPGPSSSNQPGAPLDPWTSGSPLPLPTDDSDDPSDPSVPSGIVGSLGDPDDLDPSIPTPVPDVSDFDDPSRFSGKILGSRGLLSPADVSDRNVFAFIIQRMCRRALDCDDPVTTAMCDRDMPAIRPSRCFSVRQLSRCLQTIDSLSCVDLPKTTTGWMSLRPCAALFSC